MMLIFFLYQQSLQLLDRGNVQLIFWTIWHVPQGTHFFLKWYKRETNSSFFFSLTSFILFSSLLQSWDLIVHDVKEKPSILHQTPEWWLKFPRIWVGCKEAARNDTEAVFVVCNHSRCIDPLNTRHGKNTDGIMVRIILPLIAALSALDCLHLHSVKLTNLSSDQTGVCLL